MKLKSLVSLVCVAAWLLSSGAVHATTPLSSPQSAIRTGVSSAHVPAKKHTRVTGWPTGRIRARELDRRIKVKVSGPRHRPVKVRRKVDGRWQTARKLRTSARRTVNVSFIVKKPGRWRIKVPARHGWKSKATKRLRILRNSAAVPAPTVSAGKATPKTVRRPLKVLSSGNRPYAGDYFRGVKFIVTTPNAVYDGYRFDHLVEVRAPGVVFRNSLFRGANPNPANSALLLVHPDRPNASVVVKDSSFIPRAPSVNIDGVRGSRFTLRRVEITRTVDGVHIHGSTNRYDPNAGNVSIIGSWIHDLAHYDYNGGANGVRSADGSHNDGVQIVGGRNITITGTRIDGKIANAGVMIAKDRNDISNVNISNNRLGGGAVTINVADKNYTPVKGLVMNHNVFFRGSTRHRDIAMLVTSRTRAIATATGNTWHDKSTPTPYVRIG